MSAGITSPVDGFAVIGSEQGRRALPRAGLAAPLLILAAKIPRLGRRGDSAAKDQVDRVTPFVFSAGLRTFLSTSARSTAKRNLSPSSRDTMGMNWIIRATANGHTIVAHEGGTGGYSSLVAFDRAAKRAVVLLSDTALTSLGVLGTLAGHLFDPSVPVGVPRIVATADAKLIDALVGRYRLRGAASGSICATKAKRSPRKARTVETTEYAKSPAFRKTAVLGKRRFLSTNSDILVESLLVRPVAGVMCRSRFPGVYPERT
jgi:hypothetical protein